jgi:hypothetical protein
MLITLSSENSKLKRKNKILKQKIQDGDKLYKKFFDLIKEKNKIRVKDLKILIYILILIVLLLLLCIVFLFRLIYLNDCDTGIIYLND